LKVVSAFIEPYLKEMGVDFRISKSLRRWLNRRHRRLSMRG
jgi:hypothetical protein